MNADLRHGGVDFREELLGDTFLGSLRYTSLVGPVIFLWFSAIQANSFLYACADLS